MYESELNERIESGDSIPAAVRQKWAQSGKNITARSLIAWGEHCTECAIPHCFKTCDLYKIHPVNWSCQRFWEGMTRVTGVESVMPWLIKIHYKKWGKLWADGTKALRPVSYANRAEKINKLLGTVVRTAPMPSRVRKSLSWRYGGVREKWSRNRVADGEPDYFLVEAYNPGAVDISLTLYFRTRDPKKPQFVSRMVMPPGFRRIGFPTRAIREKMNLEEYFAMEISPSDDTAQLVVYFGCMDFVKDSSFRRPEKPGGCKCVVWDLDNTVWDGVLIEDGADALKLKPGIKDIFAELDRRGILISVASKNNAEDVMPVLQRFGLADYILKPEISWEAKGQAVRRIAQGLNIGLDSILYVDDSPFERAEVAAACPEVTIIDEMDANWILSRDECQVLSSEESSKRRELYRNQEAREDSLKQSDGDYEAFLRDCEIRVRVLSVDNELLGRVHELAQRTNQMNFSGTRYSREQLEAVIADKNVDAYAVDVQDRFGEYGIVGFAVIDRAEEVLTDLAFSCRIQSKRIEHAFLTSLLRKYPRRPFHARWKKTDRNAPAGKVFADLGFRETGVSEGVTLLEFAGETVPKIDFISVQDETGSPII